MRGYWGRKEMFCYFFEMSSWSSLNKKSVSEEKAVNIGPFPSFAGRFWSFQKGMKDASQVHGKISHLLW